MAIRLNKKKDFDRGEKKEKKKGGGMKIYDFNTVTAGLILHGIPLLPKKLPKKCQLILYMKSDPKRSTLRRIFSQELGYVGTFGPIFIKICI